MSASSTRITTISFDADDTLWDFEKVMREALRYALEELRQRTSLAPDSLSVETMIAIRDEVWEEWKGRETNLGTIRLLAFRRTLAYVGLSDETRAAHLNLVYLKHRWEDIQLFDDDEAGIKANVSPGDIAQAAVTITDLYQKARALT